MSTVIPLDRHRRPDLARARPAHAVCELAAHESPGAVVAELRRAGVTGVHVHAYGARRWLVRTLPTPREINIGRDAPPRISVPPKPPRPILRALLDDALVVAGGLGAAVTLALAGLILAGWWL